MQTKIVTVDIFLSVLASQNFEVPLDYEIKGSTPLEAYQNLIDDCEEQNPNAIYRPEYVELGEYGCEFIGLKEEFYIYNKHTKEDSVKHFNSKEIMLDNFQRGLGHNK
jgi:hypothetical protein